MNPTKSEGPRSLFSIATTLPLGQNYLHQFYHTLLSDCDYPLLSKILFLQLVTKENILVYSSRRAEIKEVWHGLNQKIKDNQHTILVIDQQTDIRQLLELKGERRVLLFDLGKINTQALNQLLNHSLQNLTLLAIEDETRPLRPELSDLFPLVFRDEEDEELAISSQINSTPFDKQRFKVTVGQNFAQSLESKQDDAFFKPYLSMLKEKTHSRGAVLPHSRWKKMNKILQLIGATRSEGVFKCLSPSDCLISPECLGRTPQELQIIAKANEQTLLQMIPLYGIERWRKQTSSHFWLTSSRKAYFLSLFKQLKTRPSFYFPITKYPQVVSLCHDAQSLHYCVKGYDKKLMSDKHLQINSKKTYRLAFRYKCVDNVIIHAGVASFDSKRIMISPVQVCRVEESAVMVQGIDHDKIAISPEEVSILSKWNQSGLAYQRCIGFYSHGKIDKFIDAENVISPQENPYSKEITDSPYQSLSEKGIQLSPFGLKELKRLKIHIIPGVTKVMNHYQGGTYSIGGTFSGCQPEWKQIEMIFKGQGRTNNGQQFLIGTQYIRVVLLLNYNSGYPNFSIEKKDAQVNIKDIEWSQI